MAADRALAELDQRARDDVGAFDRDADRHRAIDAAEIVQRAVLHGLAAVDVHGVVDRDAHALGGLRLHDGGDDRGLVAVVDARAGEAPRGVEQIGGRRHAAEPLLDGFEPADRHMELLAHARIHAGGVGGEAQRRRRQRRQRNAAPGGERAHQHLPALADLLDAADDVVHRDEDVAARVRAVLEGLQRRQVPAADLDAGQVGRHQRQRDADVVARRRSDDRDRRA